MEKNLQQRLDDLQQAYPTVSVRLWCMDEHRLGLKPIHRRAWFPWWVVPIAPFKWRFEWCWVYGFVEPHSGQTDWWLLPRANSLCLSQVLGAFAKANGIDAEHPALLVLDQARWHTTQKLQRPPGLSLEFLPPYSPELQPAERLWSLVDQPVVNQYFETIEALEEVVAQRCRQLSQQADLIRRFTDFHWWPQSSLCMS